MGDTDREAHLHRGLVDGLLGTDPEHARLYMQSAWFRTQIDALASTLPLWVPGLAVLALETEERQAAMIRELSNGPGPSFPLRRPD